MSAYTQFAAASLLFHLTPRSARLRPFVSVGGGGAFYSGTGRESASQPLNSYVALTHTRETKGMVCGGAGLKYRVGGKLGVRVEIRDYATPFPSRILASAPGASGASWLHHIVPSAGIVWTFGGA